MTNPENINVEPDFDREQPVSVKLINLAYKADVKTTALRFLLVTLANMANDDGECWPSIRFLSDRTLLTRQWVEQSIKSLEQMGHLTVTRKIGVGSRYAVHPIAPTPQVSCGDDNPASELRGPRKSVAGTPQVSLQDPASELRLTVKNRKEPSINPCPGVPQASPNGAQGYLIAPEECGVPPEPKAKPKGPTPEQVETIYQAYPRKEGKSAGLDAIRKALLAGGVSYDELLRKVRIYAECRAGQETKYTPYPQKWFNQKRWQDDPASWRAASKPDTNGKPYVKSLQEKESERIARIAESGSAFYG